MPTKAILKRHEAQCLGSTPDDVENLKRLQAVDHILDIIIGTNEWALPAHTFTNYRAIPTATRSGIYEMQNTMSRGRGGGEKKNGWRKLKKKGPSKKINKRRRRKAGKEGKKG